MRLSYYKLADLRFADWHTSEICGFAIAECAKELADLRTNKQNLRAQLWSQDRIQIFRKN
jgi:hypothetical protein